VTGFAQAAAGEQEAISLHITVKTSAGERPFPHCVRLTVWTVIGLHAACSGHEMRGSGNVRGTRGGLPPAAGRAAAEVGWPPPC
jgi:hypothetical protein